MATSLSRLAPLHTFSLPVELLVGALAHRFPRLRPLSGKDRPSLKSGVHHLGPPEKLGRLIDSPFLLKPCTSPLTGLKLWAKRQGGL